MRLFIFKNRDEEHGYYIGILSGMVIFAFLLALIC